MAKTNFLGKWGVMVLLALALAIIIIDTTLLNVSLGTIIRELGTTVKQLQWVITGYALVLTAFTITGGRLGDLFGRKKMFMLGAFIFAVGSFIASISQSIGPLVWGEAIIEGFGAALMMPATTSLLLANFHGKDRAVAFGMWGGIAGAASAIGPILGGWLTTNYSWRWGFRINVGVAALLIIMSLLMLKESRDTKEKPQLDWFGVLLSSVGLLGIVYGIIESSTYGWVHAKEAFAIGSQTFDLGGISIVPFAVIAGLLFLYAFVRWELRREKRGETPLVSMKLFKSHQFTSGTVTTAVLFMGQTGIFFTLPIFLQAVRGLDALHTGLALLPMSLAILVIAPLSAQLGGKVYPKHLIQIGMVTTIVGVMMLSNGLTVNAEVWDLAPGLILYGIGFAFVMSQINNLTLSGVPVYMAGEASGVHSTLRQLGSSLGSAIMGAILLSALASNVSRDIAASTVIPEQVKPELAAALPAQASNVEFGGRAELPRDIPPQAGQEILRISKQATTDANHTVFLYSMLFVGLGLLMSHWLPKTDPHKRAKGHAPAPAGH